MSTTTRKQLLAAVEEIWQEQPDWRFGQLVSNLALFARGPFASATYDVEDEELLKAAQRHLQNLQERREAKEQVKQLVAAQRVKSAA